MEEQSKEDLKKRIDRLERRVEELESKISQASAADVTSREEARNEKKRNAAVQAARSESRWRPENINLGEQWLNRLGIGLLLIGVAFLFKYTIDQGWLIPPVRSAIGLGIGVLLFVSGIQMKEENKPMKQILLGGGIAVFYITGFATFQLYTFVAQPVVWAFMVVVTLLALSLSLQQDEAVLSNVGTLGALGTPFMLYTGEGSVVMLMVYITLVLSGAAAIYLKKGWKSLLWTMALGSVPVFVVAIATSTIGGAETMSAEHWSLQLGLLVWLLVAWMLPVSRDMLSKADLRRWPSPEMTLDDGSIDEHMEFSSSSSVHLMVFLVPLVALGLSSSIWEFSMSEAGFAAMGLAVFGSVFYLPLKSRELPKLALSHTFLGLVMLTIGFFLLLEGNTLFVVLAAEMVALRFVAFQTGDERIGIGSHLLFGILVFWLMNLMRVTDSITSIETISQLGVIAAGGLLIPRWLKSSDLKQLYRIVCHLVLLVWLYQRLVEFENGQALITVSWGVYSVVLLILGFVRYGRKIRFAGMATIFLVVGKLILIDLAQLEAIWRILLFIGFGAVFLILGYYWQSKWQRGESESA